LQYEKVDTENNYRRPTFDEIVNWYANGSIEPKVEQPEPRQADTSLFDKILAETPQHIKDSVTQPKTPTSNEIRVMGKQAIEAINKAINSMEEYEATIEALEESNSCLTNANSALSQEVERLNRLVHGNSNAALVAENTTLKAEVARLNHWINMVKSFS